jgi:hypothetical protein
MTRTAPFRIKAVLFSQYSAFIAKRMADNSPSSTVRLFSPGRSNSRKRIGLSANDLFSFRIEESHFFQVELDRHLFVRVEEMFAMDSGDQVTGA